MYKTDEQKYEMYMTYDEGGGGGLPLSGENGPYATREDEWKTFMPKRLYADVDKKICYWVETLYCNFNPAWKVGEAVYVIVVRYGTGNSFGGCTGEWFIEGAYLDADDAKAVVESINNDLYEGGKPWDGYFKNLEDVELHKFILQDTLYGSDRYDTDDKDSMTFFDHS